LRRKVKKEVLYERNICKRESVTRRRREGNCCFRRNSGRRIRGRERERVKVKSSRRGRRGRRGRRKREKLVEGKEY
jgi:hypothetical protein